MYEPPSGVTKVARFCHYVVSACATLRYKDCEESVGTAIVGHCIVVVLYGVCVQ